MRIASALLLVTLSFAGPRAFGDEVVLRKIVPGDQLGFLLKCLGHKKLWGSKGAVIKAVRLNESRLVRRIGNLIFPKSNLRLPLPPGLDAETALTQIETCRDDRDAASVDETPAPTSFSVPEAKLKSKKIARRKASLPPPESTPLGEPEEMSAEPKPELDPEVTPEPTPDPTEVPVRVVKDPAPAAAAAPTPTATPLATPAPTERAAEAKRPTEPQGRWYAGLDLTSRQFRFAIPSGANTQASRGFISVILGGRYPLTEKIDAFGDITLGAVQVWNDATETLRPFDVRLGASYRHAFGEKNAVVLRGYAKFMSTIGGTLATPGYRNLLGPVLRVEGRRRFGAGEASLALALGIINSDSALITPQNREIDVCVGYEPRALVDGGHFDFFGCYERLDLGNFANGTGTQNLWRFGALYHF